MSLKKRIYSVLVISAAERFNRSLSELLPKSQYYPVHIVSGITAAKRMIAERFFDFVIINSPLPDEKGLHFAIDASTVKNAVVLLLVRSDLYVGTFDKMAEHGVFVLSRPTSSQIVIHALEWMSAARERSRRQENQAQTLEDKIIEISIVNRAKLLLISEMHMNEAQAHRYIEKQAMDRCITKKTVAEELIKLYS